MSVTRARAQELKLDRNLENVSNVEAVEVSLETMASRNDALNVRELDVFLKFYAVIVKASVFKDRY